MPTSSRKLPVLLYASIAILLAAIIVADIFTPRGYAVWILYPLPTALTLFARRRAVPVIVAGIASALVIAGFLMTPFGLSFETSLFNRLVGILTTWSIAAVALMYVNSRVELQTIAWRQRGEVLLSAAMRGEQNPAELATSILRTLVNYLDAKVAVLYSLEANTLHRLGSWALGSPDDAPKVIALGEGLVGQAVRDVAPIVARALPHNYLKISSGLGSAAPAHVIVAPITADGEVVGVLELGFSGAVETLAGGLDDILDDARDLLRQSGESLGMAVRSALFRGKLQALLEETQRQSEELQVQQEELRVSNEELEERGRALQESQARLENQQAELEQTNSHLEEHAQRLERQKRDLLSAQDALQHNARALEQASQYKSEFLANMSHELRTPLNSSLILAKLLLDNKTGNLSTEQVRYASTIYSSNTDLLSLINDILDLAKVEAGHMDFMPEPIALAAVLQALALTFEPVATEKRLGFRVERATGLPDTLVTDGQRLQQILRNLLSNAFKFTSTGEVVLYVAPAPNGQIRFEVRDTGIGIAPQNRDSIFEAFQQADGTTSRRYGGSGLGLSISRELAHLLGGELAVSSELGRGSTFSLTIPVLAVAPQTAAMHGTEAGLGAGRAAAGPAAGSAAAPAPGAARGGAAAITPTVPQSRAAAANTARAASAASAAAFARANGTDSANLTHPMNGTDASSGNRAGAANGLAGALPAGIADDRDHLSRGRRLILVIEDDAAFARILYDLAHELDFDCVHAPNGAEGMQLAKQLQPCGILLDLSLPDDSGLIILERLKRDSATRHLPIHIVSVANHSETALQLGAIGYSLKPTARDELASAIHKLEARLAQRVRHLLVVEDDPLLRENIQLLLRTDDVRIDGVGTVSDALARLAATAYDCVVMDLALPDGSGYDLLKSMAADERAAYPPVIVYTGRSLNAEEERRLRQYSKSIIIKGAKSPERLLDEVTLFLHSVESELPPDRQRMLKEVRQRDAAFEGRKILLAEDDVRNIFALSHVLEPLGATLEIARNGREAVTLIEQRTDIDLVLMDIMMPEMDGLEAMREIRSRPGFERLPIIALTAKAMSSDRQRCLDAGANDYISKPIEVEKLLSLCRVWLPH